jgi:diaminopropionate ammonia-lyase
VTLERSVPPSFLINPTVRRDAAFRGAFDEDEYERVAAYFGGHNELTPTPLRTMPALARELGIAELLVKDETNRFGLEAFKIVGVRYALSRLDEAALARGLVCATAGNHGRAVARVAREASVHCTVFVPAPQPSASDIELRWRARRVSSMRDDGASVVDVDGSYEEALRLAAVHAESTGATVVSDAAWHGYEQIPRWIMAGYTRLFDEAKRQWRRQPDLVFVQGGVGGLVCAAASWFSRTFGAERPRLIAAEPSYAACLLESARAGHPIVLEGELPTMMAGLRCAEPSPAAWPAIRDGIDAFVSASDDAAREAIVRLRSGSGGDPAIVPGPSGACGLASLIRTASDPALTPLAAFLRMNGSTRALIVVTEGE